MPGRRRAPWRVCRVALLALFLASLGFPTAPRSALTCDEDLVRARAEASVPGYRVSTVRIHQGVVTLVFAAREGPGAFAVALRAAGTKLATSVMGTGLDRAEVARASWPIAGWWEDAELERTLAACSDGLPQAMAADLDGALHAAVDAGFVPFEYLAPGRLVDAGKFLAEARSPGCTVSYRGGNCYAIQLASESDRATFEITAPCRSIEERFRLEPIIEAQVPAQAYRGEVYARDPLPLGFYRIRERAVFRARSSN